MGCYSIPTREYQDMNLSAHIITCSPPSMNLPTHGTTSPDPSLASLRTTNTHKPLPTALSPGTA